MKTTKLTHLLFLTYSLFLLGFFFVPNAVDLYKFYSVAVFIPALFVLPQALQSVQSKRLFILLVLYIAYMLATTGWGDIQGIRPFFIYLRLAVYILMFLLLTVLLAKLYPDNFEQLLRALCFAAGIAAVISLVLWYQDHPFPRSRVIGIGITEHPNPSAFVYGFFAVLGVAYATRESCWRLRLVYLLPAGVLICFVWLSQSRGGLLAIVMALITLFSLRTPRKSAVVILLLVVIGGLLYWQFPEWFASVTKRGTSSRPEIWSTLIGHILEAPFFGHGFIEDQRVFVLSQKAYHAFAHNVYLGTAREGGMVGLSLLLALLGIALWQALRIGLQMHDYRYLGLLVFGMVCVTFDLDRLIVRPKEAWIIIWLPLALILAQTRRQVQV